MIIAAIKIGNLIVNIILFTFIFFIIVFIVLLNKNHNIKKCFFNDSRKLESLLSIYANKNHYRYNSEAMFYSSCVEIIKKYIDTNSYFVTHEISGVTSKADHFTACLFSTSNRSNDSKTSSFSNFYKKKKDGDCDFTGLLLQFDFELEKNCNFALFATKNLYFIDKDELINYKFLFEDFKYENISQNLWLYANNAYPFKLKDFFISFSIYLEKFLNEENFLIVIFDKNKISILYSDLFLENAVTIEENFDWCINRVSNLFYYFKKSSFRFTGYKYVKKQQHNNNKTRLYDAGLNRYMPKQYKENIKVNKKEINLSENMLLNNNNIDTDTKNNTSVYKNNWKNNYLIEKCSYSCSKIIRNSK